jgi:serine/threonine-protein kinase RsbW
VAGHSMATAQGPAPAPPTRLNDGRVRGDAARQVEMAVILQLATFHAMTRFGTGLEDVMMSVDSTPGCFAVMSRLFAGTGIQVRAVRDYVRAGFAAHAACDDAVLVASELAANSIVHSASGYDGGMFMVHLAELDPDHVAIVVTDQGGSGRPRDRHAGPEAESGRGLAVVRSLTSFLDFFDTGKSTSALAVVPSARDET